MSEENRDGEQSHKNEPEEESFGAGEPGAKDPKPPISAKLKQKYEALLLAGLVVCLVVIVAAQMPRIRQYQTPEAWTTES